MGGQRPIAGSGVLILWSVFECGQVLLEHGASCEIRDAWGWTPLMAASHYGNATVTRSLLQHMAHLLTPTVSLDGKMPAIEAKGPVPETKARVGRLSRKGRGRKGEAPACAVEGGADGCGGVMQTEGVDGRDKNGETALFKACAEGRIETARVLLLEGAADWTIPVSPCAFS